MGAIYLKHEDHGYKVATSVDEAKADKERGWKEVRMKEGKLDDTPVAKLVDEGIVGAATADNNPLAGPVVAIHDTSALTKEDVAAAAKAEEDRLSAIADGEDLEKLAKREAARINDEHKDDKAPTRRRRVALPEGTPVPSSSKVTIEGGDKVDVHVEDKSDKAEDKKD